MYKYIFNLFIFLSTRVYRCTFIDAHQGERILRACPLAAGCAKISRCSSYAMHTRHSALVTKSDHTQVFRLPGKDGAEVVCGIASCTVALPALMARV